MQIKKFQKALEERAREIITDEQLTQVLEIDLELPFDFISLDLFSTIQKLSPFGMGNVEPIFMTSGVTIVGLKTVGKTSAHLKLTLQKDGKTFSAMWFGNGIHSLKIGQTVDAAYTIDINEWQGNKELALKIKDIKV